VLAARPMTATTRNKRQGLQGRAKEKPIFVSSFIRPVQRP
jgi:hypothetical protein